MNIIEALNYGYECLKQHSSYKLDASILLKKSCKFNDLDLIVNSDYNLSDLQEKTYKDYIHRRQNNEPIAYITQEQEFFSLNFKVDENTLIPRPDTELLVEKVIEYIKENNITSPKILDLGTGSGAIIISILKNISDATGVAVDLNPKALKKAEENSKINDVFDRLEFLESSWFSNVTDNDFDIIVANPPYITTKMMAELTPDVKNFEPNLALEGGEKGYEPYIEIIAKAPDYMKNKAKIFLEIGYDQKNTVLNLFNQQFWHNKKCFKDLGNNDRLIIVDLLKK